MNRLKKAVFMLIVALAAVFALADVPVVGANMAEDILDAGEIRIRDDYSIIVDGVDLKPDVPPVERGGMIFIPLRFAAEALKADVTWYKDEKTAELRYPGNIVIKMKVGDPVIDLGNRQRILPVAPFIFESRTMIPLESAAESGLFDVKEEPQRMFFDTREDVKGIEKPEEWKNTEQDAADRDPMKEIVDRAHRDKTTQKLKPYVFGAWGAAGLLWLIFTAAGLRSGREGFWKEQILILVMLTAGTCIPMFFMISSCWAAMVPIGTSIVGLISRETYEDKLVTMASTAQGMGLICTLFGLGILIGPAIALRDIEAIGFGIYVKIQPTITGLSLSILFSTLYGIEARKKESPKTVES